MRVFTKDLLLFVWEEIDICKESIQWKICVCVKTLDL